MQRNLGAGVLRFDISKSVSTFYFTRDHRSLQTFQGSPRSMLVVGQEEEDA